jgi:hypothetical protein
MAIYGANTRDTLRRARRPPQFEFIVREKERERMFFLPVHNLGTERKERFAEVTVCTYAEIYLQAFDLFFFLLKKLLSFLFTRVACLFSLYRERQER